MNFNRKDLFSMAGLAMIACLAASLSAQTPASSPATSGDVIHQDYKITSTIELGARGLSVNGDHEKFRSDLNYRAGFRVFDSSLLIENNKRAGEKFFDTALITSSGWGSDPSGSFRLNIDKAASYKFESSVRRVEYYNNLKNHAIVWSELVPRGSQHRSDIAHNFGDFDLTIFPERDDFRIRMGYSFNKTYGAGTNNIRFSRDEYQVNSTIKSTANDLRFGVEGKLLGFNVGANYGLRRFRDRTRFFLNDINLGNNPAATSSFINNSLRVLPVRGTTNFGTFYAQRTFANKLDFTARLIYSQSTSRVNESDLITGRASNTGNFILSDMISVPGAAKRPQTRADMGLTYRLTEDFRISNTFVFDQFNISGDNTLFERVRLTNAGGSPLADTVTNTAAYRTTGYRRFSNLIEADYQMRRWFAFHLGYRFTQREVRLARIDRNLITGVTTRNTFEELDNHTHTFLAGTKIKPTRNWTIYADAEVGQSDNVFTRLANNDVVNFRFRNIVRMNNFTINVSAITRDNDSPGLSTPFTGNVSFPSIDTTLNVKSRVFSGSLDWTPRTDLSFSGGYTYNHLTSRADIIVPVEAPIFPTTRFLQGVSEYYMRDSYFYFDVSARPIKRMSLYAAYRINDDRGQGDLVETRPQDFINSYPMRFNMPEVRIAFKITRNIDWNVGYQYYSYAETIRQNPFITNIFPAQNYTAHMPYTSLRFYFGGAADR